LGIPKSNLKIYKYPVRRFDEYRQEILENLIQIKKEFDPDLVFVPSTKDIHQDHSVISREGIRAFKRKKILGYEEPWNNIEIENKFFIKLTKDNIEKKIEALNCYESQKGRNYVDKEFIWSLSKVRSTQIGVKYAESFEIIRWVL